MPVGTVTQANMRISAVNGTAFVDFSSTDAVLPSNLGKYLKVYDSTGKSIEGWIKAAGTGETYGSEFITSWYNEPSNPYETFTVAGTDISSAINTTGYGIARQSITTSGMLLRLVNVFNLVSGGAPSYGLGDTSNNVLLSFTLNATSYKTSISTVARIILFTSSGTAANFSTTSNSLKQVLTPSTSGVTIVSTSGGATYNWAVQTSGFNYNDSSGYTYTITSAAAMSGLITAGNALCDLTTANAFVAPVGVDLSPYRGYTLRLYSGATLYAEGRISMTAPSGEALTELFTGTTFDAQGSWVGATWTIADGKATTIAGATLAQVPSRTQGALYKASLDVDIRNAGSVGLYDNPSIPTYIISLAATTGTRTAYKTYTQATGAAGVGIFGASTFSGQVDNPSYSQVTAPASTGALLLNAATGARGWTYKHASMTGNAAYTYEIVSGGWVKLGTGGTATISR